ncbi:MAG: hypothetical protein P4M00_17555 [Azospirillaceae bacterium]|nr:hypothetical protein [Azospirillaceae bacterium]
MPGIARVGVDRAGGVIIGNLAPTVRADGSPVVVAGAAITPHGDGPHLAAITVGCSATVRAQGRFICRSGDGASCGHVDSGSTDVRAG